MLIRFPLIVVSISTKISVSSVTLVSSPALAVASISSRTCSLKIPITTSSSIPALRSFPASFCLK